MNTHTRFSGKALLIVLIVFMLSVPLMACAAMTLGLFPFRMHAWDGGADVQRETVINTVRHWGFPGRFPVMRLFLFGIKALFQLGLLVLIAGLFMRLFRHHRWHACHPPHGPGDKRPHPPFGPRGHWHIYWQPDEAEDTGQAEPTGQETQEFKVE